VTLQKLADIDVIILINEIIIMLGIWLLMWKPK